MAIQLENQFYTSNFNLKYKPQKPHLIKFNRSLCIHAASISGKKLVQSGTVKAISPKEAIPFTTINPTFLSQVESSVPNKDEKLLVVCGEGLRSLMDVSNLHEGGYQSLGWLIGGFNQAKVADFPSVEETDKILQYATIGGVSYYFLQLLNLIELVGKKDS
ncbi:hypothetical protein MKX01_012520 [Papaver californicum]|nr:hypothetical protein MKX01_012520 [Papaver californicum]